MTRTLDPFDELTALFLTDPSSLGETQPRQDTASVDLLLVGHLPVRAGLWLGPYVDSIGREVGSAALLRLDLDEPTIEIYRGEPDSLPQLRHSSLQDAIDAFAPCVSQWIVRPPGDAWPEELASVGADRIVILSGADEAALVAAYRIVKDLADAAGKAGRPLPPIGLAVMGASRQAALQMVERLNRTASTFLGFEVQLIVAVPQMDASMRSSRFEPLAASASASLGSIIAWLRVDRSEQRGEGTSSGQITSPIAEPARDRHHAGPHPPPRQPPAVENRAARVDSRDARAPDSPPIKLKPQPRVDLEPRAPMHVYEPDQDGNAVPLAKHVDGLTPLPIRCPARQRIELAVDSAGCVHLLGWEQSMRDFWFVSEWVRQHLSLIMMACPDVWFDNQRRPACHLFTDRPASLSDMHGSDLRLHVLAPVKVGDQTAWYSAPLNG